MKRILFPILFVASIAGCASTGARNDDAQASDDPAATNADPTYPGRGPRVGVGIGIGSWGGRSGGGVGVGLGF